MIESRGLFLPKGIGWRSGVKRAEAEWCIHNGVYGLRETNLSNT